MGHEGVQDPESDVGEEEEGYELPTWSKNVSNDDVTSIIWLLNPFDVTPSIAFMRRKKMNKNVYDDNIQINNQVE